MHQPQLRTANGDRHGVILIVVLALLALFAVLGISFVLYADAAAKSAEIARQAETFQSAPSDQRLQETLNFFLSQLIYGTDNQSGLVSAMRGNDF